MKIMKKLLYLLMLILGLNSFGQNFVKDNYELFESSDNCQKQISQAKNDVNISGFLYPGGCTYRFINKTFSELLYRKYKFVGSYSTTECIVSPRHCCYEKGLLDTISDYFGPNFLDSIKNYADSIDKKGFGFISGLIKNDTFNLAKELINKTYDDSTLARLDDGFLRIIKMEIDSLGNIVNYEYQESSKSFIREYEKKDNQISEKLYEIIREHNKFSSATLESKPINSIEILYLHPLFLDDEDNAF